MNARCRLLAVFLAGFERGLERTQRVLGDAARSRRIEVEFLVAHILSYTDRMWPLEFTDDRQVNRYVQKVRGEAEACIQLFRSPGFGNRGRLFSSPEAREVVERAFLKKGVVITSFSVERKKEMRPLGNEKVASLGFGALFFTYMNCSNNCPLVLWWGDASAPPNTTLESWYPLLSRRANDAPITGNSD